MNRFTRSIVAMAASGVVALSALTAVAGPSEAASTGPRDCFAKTANSFGAWPSAYGVCQKGDRYAILGEFADFWSGKKYLVYGKCVTSGVTSTARAKGWFDSATAAVIKRC